MGGSDASSQALSRCSRQVVCGAGRCEDEHIFQSRSKHAVVPRREGSEDEVHDADVGADANHKDLKGVNGEGALERGSTGMHTVQWDVLDGLHERGSP